jgi:putative peptide zinc metalloprotease protein
MADAPQTFSESWYRIAGQRISLRPGVRVRRQRFRGERWIVLEDPFSNNFFRLRPAAYEFIARLRPDRTVEEVWKECLERFPVDAPGQETAIQLLSQLYFANLLQYRMAADSVQLFNRFKKRQQREISARFLNLMFMRFPLLDPDRFLVRTLPVLGKLISPVGAVLWLIVVGWALKTVFDNFGALREQAQNFLAPGNLIGVYVSLIIVKTFHEFGHAYFCRKFGGEVHVMGVMLMIFTPMPYMDATSSWGFRSRWRRALVGAAGMIVEIFLAALATFVWAGTGQGTLHSLARNVMIIASVSTVIFNGNPLLRFDGYYILSDLLEIPNLSQRALAHLRHLGEHYLFGVKQSVSPARTPKEAGWLTTYGITSGIYRLVVFTGVLFVVADRFLIIGIIMAAVCLISWVTVPLGRYIHYLAVSPRLDRIRGRAIAVSAGFAALAILFLQVVPFPNHFRAPGVLRAVERSEIVNDTSGHFAELLAPSGTQVKKDQPLIRLANRELELELAGTIARAQEIQARILKAMSQEAANLKPLRDLLDSTQVRIEKLQHDADCLTIRARHDGIWVAPGIEDFIGRWLPRGSHVGTVINPDSFDFEATVREEDVDALFTPSISGAEVRLRGQAAQRIRIERWKVIPGEQQTLPSAALGWLGGGDVAVAPDDPQGRKAAEPFFKVLAKLPPQSTAALLDGRSGRIRFNLGSEPLLPRWIRRTWQMLQKRYQL